MENQESNQTIYSNQGSFNPSDPTFIKLKLDTDKFYEKVEFFLSGKRLVLYEDGGELKEKIIEVRKPYANAEGISGLLSFIEFRANNHTVQGNSDKADYKNFIAETRKDLAYDLTVNSYDWELDENKLHYMANEIMAFLTLFLSRTVDDKERESLMTQVRSSEVLSRDRPRRSIQEAVGIR